ncbi:hypothetical protein ABBQ38_012728 [Trebouxia sp. C0009 RCD-2024]
MNYNPEATPASSTSPSTTTLQSPESHAPQARAPAPAPEGQDVWQGHLKPAEIQIIVIVVVAGLFNAFFLVLSLRLLWRRYHVPAHTGESSAASPAPPAPNLRRVTPMLVRQPDDEVLRAILHVACSMYANVSVNFGQQFSA